MSAPNQNDNLFPTLGDVAARTDALNEVDDDNINGVQAEGQEREMQEIESLCMRCHEQVSDTLLHD